MLVVGGRDDRRAEIYDPAAGEWAPAADMVVARFGQTATLVDGPPCRVAGQPTACGKVLVAGGVVATARSDGAVDYTLPPSCTTRQPWGRGPGQGEPAAPSYFDLGEGLRRRPGPATVQP